MEFVQIPLLRSQWTVKPYSYFSSTALGGDDHFGDLVSGQSGVHSFVIDLNDAIPRQDATYFRLAKFDAFFHSVVVLNDQTQGCTREHPLKRFPRGRGGWGSRQAAAA